MFRSFIPDISTEVYRSTKGVMSRASGFSFQRYHKSRYFFFFFITVRLLQLGLERLLAFGESWVELDQALFPRLHECMQPNLEPVHALRICTCRIHGFICFGCLELAAA